MLFDFRQAFGRKVVDIVVDGVRYRVRVTYVDPVEDFALVEFTAMDVLAMSDAMAPIPALSSLHGPDPFIGRITRAQLKGSELDVYEALREAVRSDRLAYARGRTDAQSSPATPGVSHAAISQRSDHHDPSPQRATSTRGLHVVPPHDSSHGAAGHAVLQRDVPGASPALRAGTGPGSPHGARVRARRRAARALTAARAEYASRAGDDVVHDDARDALPWSWPSPQPTVWPTWRFIAGLIALALAALLFDWWAARA